MGAVGLPLHFSGDELPHHELNVQVRPLANLPQIDDHRALVAALEPDAESRQAPQATVELSLLGVLIEFRLDPLQVLPGWFPLAQHKPIGVNLI